MMKWIPSTIQKTKFYCYIKGKPDIYDETAIYKLLYVMIDFFPLL